MQSMKCCGDVVGLDKDLLPAEIGDAVRFADYRIWGQPDAPEDRFREELPPSRALEPVSFEIKGKEEWLAYQEPPTTSSPRCQSQRYTRQPSPTLALHLRQATLEVAGQ
jgi:hypothetical protein